MLRAARSLPDCGGRALALLLVGGSDDCSNQGRQGRQGGHNGGRSSRVHVDAGEGRQADQGAGSQPANEGGQGFGVFHLAAPIFATAAARESTFAAKLIRFSSI